MIIISSYDDFLGAVACNSNVIDYTEILKITWL